jgi:hypothetical protein
MWRTEHVEVDGNEMEHDGIGSSQKFLEGNSISSHCVQGKEQPSSLTQRRCGIDVM